MSNTIPRRVYDFLKDYPPFSLLKKDLLMRIAQRVVVNYYRPGEVLFRAGDTPEKFIYMVREGAVQLLREEAGERVLVEECDEGDVFGIRPLLAKEAYALTAEAVEESLIYAININGFHKVLAENPEVAYYLARSFASGYRRDERPAQSNRLFIGPMDDDGADDYQLVEIQAIENDRKPVCCHREKTVQEAAQEMTRRQVGSIIIVDDERRPIGIITDKDLRRKIATGQQPLNAPVSVIMSSPVITVAPDITVADVQIEMVKKRIHHLIITEDGTDQSPVRGVVTEHDLLVIQGNNPAVLLRETKRARSGPELRHLRDRAEVLLKKYIFQEVSIAYISTVMTEINDAIIRRSIKLALGEMETEGFGPPPAPFCWLALGSEGRGEQLLRTDQDNALLFADVPEGQYESTKKYFLTFAAKVTSLLHQVGFEYCPADMMASNPNWCLSLEQWKKQFNKWILQPTPKAVLYCTIFFDYRPVYGPEELTEALTRYIFELSGDQTVFLAHLAKNATDNPPPLTFFRNFVVEKSGEHEDEFDIKGRAMMPLTDAARVLTLHAQIGKLNNTFRRFDKLAELEPRNRELYEQAADAYEILMRYRALQGLKQGDSGRFFKPSELSKMERLNLRNSFRPIRDLQSLLHTRFQLSFMG